MRNALAAAMALAFGAAQAQDLSDAASLTAEFEVKQERGEALASEIGAMVARDQFIRSILIEGFQRPMSDATRQAFIDATRGHFERVDSANTARLKEILAETDFEDLAAISRSLAQSAVTLVSHSPDADFQRGLLPTFERMARAGTLNADAFANLYDDVTLNDRGVQRYGMNMDCQNGAWTPKPLEDAEQVDARRAEIGLGPLAAHREQLAALYGPCPDG